MTECLKKNGCFIVTEKPLRYSDYRWAPVSSVCGSPCSGKTTTIDAVVKPGELIVEFDRLMMALTPVGTHDHADSVKAFAWSAQAALLRRLRFPSQIPRAYLTALAPTNAQRARYLIGPKASMTVLQVSQETAHNRAEEAGRPGAWHEFINTYFERYEEPEDPRVKVFNTEEMI